MCLTAGLYTDYRSEILTINIGGPGCMSGLCGTRSDTVLRAPVLQSQNHSQNHIIIGHKYFFHWSCTALNNTDGYDEKINTANRIRWSFKYCF